MQLRNSRDVDHHEEYVSYPGINPSRCLPCRGQENGGVEMSPSSGLMYSFQAVPNETPQGVCRTARTDSKILVAGQGARSSSPRDMGTWAGPGPVDPGVCYTIIL